MHLTNTAAKCIIISLVVSLIIIPSNFSSFPFDDTLQMSIQSIPDGLAFGQSSDSSPINLSDNDGSSSSQRVVTAGSSIFVVWQDNSDGDWDIFFARSTDGGETFSEPDNLSNNGGASTLPKISTNNDGSLVAIAWSDNSLGAAEIFFARSTDGGETFSEPDNLTSNSLLVLNPSVAVAGEDNIVVVWSSNEGTQFDIYFSSSEDKGLSFSEPTNLSNNDHDSSAPQLYTVAQDVYLVWIDNVSGNKEVMVSLSDDSGSSFSEPVNVSNSDDDSSNPRLAASSDGKNVFLAWEEGSDNREILLTQSDDSGSSFSEPVNVSNSDDDSSNPRLAASSDGKNVFLAWEEEQDIFMRIISDGELGEPVNISDTSGESREPSISASDTTAVVVWIEESTYDQEILANIISADPSETPEIINVASGDELSATSVQIVDSETEDEAQNRAVVTWVQEVSGDKEVMATTVSVVTAAPSTLTINVVDANDQTPLGGAAFEITPDPFSGTGSLIVEDNDENDDSKDNGTVVLSGILPDSYSIEQTTIPDGYLSLVRKQTVSVTEAGTSVTVIFSNLKLEEELAGPVEVPAPYLDEESLAVFIENGATIDGVPIDSIDDLPPAFIVPLDSQVQEFPDVIIKSVVFEDSSLDYSSTSSEVFEELAIPTYTVPEPDIANSIKYVVPSFIIPAYQEPNVQPVGIGIFSPFSPISLFITPAYGELLTDAPENDILSKILSFIDLNPTRAAYIRTVLSPVLERISEGMTVQMSPKLGTESQSAIVNDITIRFGTQGVDTGLRFDMDDTIGDDETDLPPLVTASVISLFIDSIGQTNSPFSLGTSFASPTTVLMHVDRNLPDASEAPDGCPLLEFYIFDEEKGVWVEPNNPERVVSADESERCGFVIETDHFSKFAVGGIGASIIVTDAVLAAVLDGQKSELNETRTVPVYSDSDLQEIPLKSMQMASVHFLDSEEDSVLEVASGEAFTISTMIENNQNKTNDFTYIAQIIDSEGSAIDIRTFTETIDPGRALIVDFDITELPDGIYEFRFLVWDQSSDIPNALSYSQQKFIQVGIPSNANPS
jgi:hypothetical protein